VLLSVIFTVFLLPSSAHNEIDRHVSVALKGLLKLHALVWVPLQDTPALLRAGGGAGEVAVDVGGGDSRPGGEGGPEAERDAHRWGARSEDAPPQVHPGRHSEDQEGGDKDYVDGDGDGARGDAGASGDGGKGGTQQGEPDVARLEKWGRKPGSEELLHPEDVLVEVRTLPLACIAIGTSPVRLPGRRS
jgi:hypothetical protein